MTPTPTAAVRGSDTATVHSPDLVVRAAGPADVATAVRAARDCGRRAAVQATGHGAPPAGPGTVLVLTGHLDTVTVDPAARTAARWTVPAGGATCA